MENPIKVIFILYASPIFEKSVTFVRTRMSAMVELIVTEDNRSTLRETCHSATFLTTYLTRTGPSSNSDPKLHIKSFPTSQRIECVSLEKASRLTQSACCDDDTKCTHQPCGKSHLLNVAASGTDGL